MNKLTAEEILKYYECEDCVGEFCGCPYTDEEREKCKKVEEAIRHLIEIFPGWQERARRNLAYGDKGGLQHEALVNLAEEIRDFGKTDNEHP